MMKPYMESTGWLIALWGLARRFSIAFLVVASFALILFSKKDFAITETARIWVLDVTAPVLDIISRPAGTIASIIEYIDELIALRRENIRLAAENSRLSGWETIARRLEAENKALRNQLNFIPGPDAAFITARVIGDSGGAFVNSLMINAGSDDGIRKGLAVLSGEVLVGRVAETGRRSARILLLTDINARVPVIVETSRTRAILAGENGPQLKLNYLSSTAGIAVGDRIITSAHGSAFPPGIPVGVVSHIKDNQIKVDPFLNRHQLEIVTIVDYGMSAQMDDRE